MKTTIIAVSVLALLSTASFADAPNRGEAARKHAARTTAQYRHMAKNDIKHVERTQTMTRNDGSTATRTTTIDHDPENKTFTRQTTGERFNGETYSATDVRQRTEDGFTRNSSRTNGAGETVSRDVVTTADKDAGTLHKEITVTDKNGETHNRVIDRSRQVSGQE